MFRILALGVLVLIVAQPGCAPSDKGVPVQAECPDPESSQHFFPSMALTDRAGRDDRFLASWYTLHLSAMREPSLSCRGPDAMRFTWLRTFHHPVAVRIEWDDAGAATLTAIEMGGAGGYEPGEQLQKVQRVLSAEELARLSSSLEQENFWGMDPPQQRSGLDGSQWMLEGRRGARYRALSDWTPQDGAVKRLGMTFLSLTGWTLEPIY